MRQHPVVLAAAVLVAAGLGLFLGMSLGRKGGSTGGGADARVKALEDQVASLRTALDEARAAAAAGTPPAATADQPDLSGRAEKPVASLVPSVPAESAGTGSDGEEARGGLVRIPGLDSALAEVDWDEVGSNVIRMRPDLDAFAESRAHGTNLAPEVLRRIQTHNRPLVMAALTFEGGLKSGDPNTAYTHPAFLSNAIVAALENAKMPLSDAQQKAVAEVAVRYTEEETKRKAAYAPDTWELQKILDEAELRDRFYDETFALLTPEQQAALVNPALRGRVGVDLFSSGLTWQMRQMPLLFRDVDQLAELVVARIVASLGGDWTDVQKDDLARLVAEWLATWPRGTLETVADPYALAGMTPTLYVRESGRRQLAFLQSLGAALSFEPARLQALRAGGIVYVPLRRPAE
jgi:hypothetical protein